LNIDPATVSINLVDGEIIDPALEGKIVGIRPENMAIAPSASHHGLEGEVIRVSDDPLEDRLVIHVRLGSAELQISTRDGSHVRPGDEVEIEVRRMHVFDRDSESREWSTSGPSLP
jgi:ABC-type sugar transport system ATPase subunit